MDNRKTELLSAKDLFKVSSVKSIVSAKFDAWEKELRDKLATSKMATPEKKQKLDDLAEDVRTQVKKQVAPSILSEGVLSHSSVWIPVCVNYGNPEYSKQEYLDLMQHVVNMYGSENVTMSLFPNRHLKGEDGKLLPENEAIAISLSKWNQEEPKGVVVGEDGFVQISDNRYQKLKGLISDSAKCFPEDYQSNFEKLNQYCDPTNKKEYKKDIAAELSADLHSAIEKFSLAEDEETNKRLSSEHIKRETAFLISQGRKKEVIDFSQEDIQWPEFHTVIILYPHDLFKTMTVAMKKAFLFDRYSYSLAAVKFKRLENKEALTKAVSPTQESTEDSVSRAATQPLAIQKNKKSSSMQGTLFVGDRKDAPHPSTTHLGAPSPQRKGRSSLRDSSGDSSEDLSGSAPPSPISSSPTSDRIAVVGRKGSGQTEIQMANEMANEIANEIDKDEPREKQPLNRRSSNTTPVVSAHALFAVKSTGMTEMEVGQDGFSIRQSQSFTVNSEIANPKPPLEEKGRYIGGIISGGVSGLFTAACKELNTNKDKAVMELAEKVTTALTVAVLNNS